MVEAVMLWALAACFVIPGIIAAFGLATDEDDTVMFATCSFLVGLAIWFVAGLIFMGFASLHEGSPPSGPVIGKRHREAYTSTTMVKSGSTFVPIVQHHPEAWYLTVEDDGGERGVSVSEGTFDRYEIGDHYEPTEEKRGD